MKPKHPKWTAEHHSTRAKIDLLDAADREIRRRKAEADDAFRKASNEVLASRTEIQNQCKHTEEIPGFLVAATIPQP